MPGELTVDSRVKTSDFSHATVEKKHQTLITRIALGILTMAAIAGAAYAGSLYSPTIAVGAALAAASVIFIIRLAINCLSSSSAKTVEEPEKKEEIERSTDLELESISEEEETLSSPSINLNSTKPKPPSSLRDSIFSPPSSPDLVAQQLSEKKISAGKSISKLEHWDTSQLDHFFEIVSSPPKFVQTVFKSRRFNSIGSLSSYLLRHPEIWRKNLDISEENVLEILTKNEIDHCLLFDYFSNRDSLTLAEETWLNKDRRLIKIFMIYGSEIFPILDKISTRHITQFVYNLPIGSDPKSIFSFALKSENFTPVGKIGEYLYTQRRERERGKLRGLFKDQELLPIWKKIKAHYKKNPPREFSLRLERPV